MDPIPLFGPVSGGSLSRDEATNVRADAVSESCQWAVLFPLYSTGV
jgi:hypothetical protein